MKTKEQARAEEQVQAEVEIDYTMDTPSPNPFYQGRSPKEVLRMILKVKKSKKQSEK